MQVTSLICVSRATKLFLYSLLQLNSKRVRAEQAINCSCCAERGWLRPSFSSGACLHKLCCQQRDNWDVQGTMDTGLSRKWLVQRHCRAVSAISMAVTAQCWQGSPASAALMVSLLRRYHDGQGSCFYTDAKIRVSKM